MKNFHQWLQENLEPWLQSNLEPWLQKPDDNAIPIAHDGQDSDTDNKPQQSQSTSLSDLLKLNNQQKEYLQKNFTIVPDQNKIIIQHKQNGGQAEIAKIHTNNPMKMQEFKSEVIALMNPQQQQTTQPKSTSISSILGMNFNGKAELVNFQKNPNLIGIRITDANLKGYGNSPITIEKKFLNSPNSVQFTEFKSALQQAMQPKK